MSSSPTLHAPTLQSFIAGRWIGQHGAQVLRSALDGHEIFRTHEERPDFAEAIEHGRRQGVSGLMALDFQQRAQRLKALALPAPSPAPWCRGARPVPTAG